MASAPGMVLIAAGFLLAGWVLRGWWDRWTP
jgi:hypothetical protein